MTLPKFFTASLNPLSGINVQKILNKEEKTMATVGNSYPNLKDFYSQMEGGKITSTLIDLFMPSNVMLEDAIAVECNDGSSHVTTVRNGLPEPEFRKFYQGVSTSKGEYTQVKDTTAMLESYSQIDKKLADLNGNTKQFRLNEADSHINGMNNTVQRNVIYGNKGKNSSAFDGLATRYGSISKNPGSIGYQVIDGGGKGTDNTSIYLVAWGDKAVHFIYPKGSQAGLKHEDLGEDTVKDENGKSYQAYVDHFSWDIGLSIRNYRTSGRIANIDVTKLGQEDGIDLIEAMIKLYHRCKKHAKTSSAKLVWYVNETIETYLHLQARKDKNVNLTVETVEGQPVVKFLGIPAKCCDQILDTEDTVVAAA